MQEQRLIHFLLTFVALAQMIRLCSDDIWEDDYEFPVCGDGGEAIVAYFKIAHTICD
jgi:hypothetical protein